MSRIALGVKKAEDVTEEHDDDTDVEQICTPHQVFFIDEFAALALPGKRANQIPGKAAEKQDCQDRIRHHLEDHEI